MVINKLSVTLICQHYTHWLRCFPIDVRAPVILQRETYRREHQGASSSSTTLLRDTELLNSVSGPDMAAKLFLCWTSDDNHQPPIGKKHLRWRISQPISQPNSLEKMMKMMTHVNASLQPALVPWGSKKTPACARAVTEESAGWWGREPTPEGPDPSREHVTLKSLRIYGLHWYKQWQWLPCGKLMVKLIEMGTL